MTLSYFLYEDTQKDLLASSFWSLIYVMSQLSTILQNFYVRNILI